MVNHHENSTWRLVRRDSVPKGSKILRTKWVYDDKKGQWGEIIRFKARLTAMGNFQREGVDYFETYASVMRTKTMRVLLQLLNACAEHKMEHWDIKAAFINAKLEEDIWIYQPDGHQQKGLEDMICKLDKALYGLKQAGRAWQKLLKSILLEAGFSQLLKDEGAFVAHTEDGGWCVVGTHVDDLFPLYNVKGRILRDKMFEVLEKRVKVKNEGEIKWALKILIERDIDKGTLKISQGQFVREVLQRFGFDKEYTENTPAYDQGPNSVMEAEDLPASPEAAALLHSIYPIYEALGCLWWLANNARLDIYFPVFQASQYASKPSKKLWLWITKIFKYLSMQPDRGLIYHRPEFIREQTFVPRGIPLLGGHVDASFADSPGKRSTLGQLYWFLGAAIDWKSKRSTRVLDSSTDAECASLVVFGKENAWLRDFLKELTIFEINTPTEVGEDNTAAIALSGQGPTKRSRHFDIAFYKFKQQIEYKEMILKHVNTHENPADFFTKALPRVKFEFFRDMIMGGMQTKTCDVVHITHLRMAKRKPIPERFPDEEMEKMLTDKLPDYASMVTVEERHLWERMEAAFQRLPRKPNIRKTKLLLKPFSKKELEALQYDQEANETKARKIYYKLQNLLKSPSTSGIYGKLDAIGEQVVWWMNKGGKPYVRLKRHDAIVVTFIKGSAEYEQFKSLHLQTLDQMAHLDKPAFIKGMKIIKVPGVVTVFVTLSAMRAMTQFLFELGMEDILGNGTETVNGDRNKWILWRLRLAHQFAFKIQSEADEKAFSNGEWEHSTLGDVVAFDPERDWHRGRQALTCSDTPEVFAVYQLVLPDFGRFFDVRLNTTGGFGQYEWTQKVFDTQMKELRKNVVDLHKALDIAPEEPGYIQDLQNLSNMFQTTFRVPLGILVQSDPLWMKTESAGFWQYSEAERKQWCLEMPETVFGEWQRLVIPICEPENKRRKEFTIDGTGVKRVCDYIWTYPGRIFAIRIGNSLWHHPNCNTMEKLYEREIHFRDLMGGFNPLSPEYHEMWKALTSASTCCGSLWISSILHYAGEELKEPPTLRLMTLNERSQVYGKIEARMYADEADNVAQARATFDILGGKDPWIRYSQLLREIAVEKRLYHGDVFQPRLFNDLAKMLGILEKRRLFEPMYKGLLLGSQGPEEKHED